MPGTIDSPMWFARNEDKIGQIVHGLVLSCLGDLGDMTYKQSRRGNTAIDRIVPYVLRHDKVAHRVNTFVPYGYDERQYCSPGFYLPVGCLIPTPNDEYPEYRSAADNLSLLRPETLVHSLSVLRRTVDCIEWDAVHRKPQCQRRATAWSAWALREHGRTARRELRSNGVAVGLELADRHHSLLDMAERAGLPFATVRAGAARSPPPTFSIRCPFGVAQKLYATRGGQSAANRNQPDSGSLPIRRAMLNGRIFKKPRPCGVLALRK
jgi:aminopeptidase-like protein